MNWLRKNSIEIVFILLTGIFITVFMYLMCRGFYISFFDTDDHMRLVRIREFFIHHDLSNNIIERANVPYGCDLHWTRLYDFFLIIPSYLLNFFTNSIDQAIEYVGFFISPIIKCITSILIYDIFSRALRKYDAFLIAMFFSANFIIQPLEIFGRPDHHAFIILSIILYLKSLWHFLENPESEKNCMGTALASFICVWASPETLIPLLLADAVLFFSFSENLKKMKAVYKKNMLTAILIGTLEMITVQTGAIALMCIIVMMVFALLGNSKIFLPFLLCYTVWFADTIQPISYDKISVVHVVLYMLIAAVFIITIYLDEKRKTRRLLQVSILGVIFAGIFIALYPKFIYGMSGDISDYAKSLWLSRVAEMKSPFKNGFYSWFAIYFIIVFWAIGYNLIYVKFKKAPIFWYIISTITFFYTLFGWFAMRMLPYSTLFSTSIIVYWVMYAKPLIKVPRYWKAILMALIVMAIPFISTKSDEPKKKDEKTAAVYTKRELYQEIEKIIPQPSVIMSEVDRGPEILYYTKHSAVGAPYHRSTEGIIACCETLEKKFDEGVALKNLKKTNASYILIKKVKVKKDKNENQKNLMELLSENKIPDWLTSINLPKKFENIILMKINL